MEKKLEEISKKLLQEIRKYLKDNNLFDKNYKIELVLGKYSIFYKREHDKKFDYEVDLPIEIFNILKNCIIEMDALWVEEGDEKEWEENRLNAEHGVDLIIDGYENELNDVGEIRALISALTKRKEECVAKQEFEEAARLRDRISKYETKIDNSK